MIDRLGARQAIAALHFLQTRVACVCRQYCFRAHPMRSKLPTAAVIALVALLWAAIIIVFLSL